MTVSLKKKKDVKDGRLSRLDLLQMTAILMENHFFEHMVREGVKKMIRESELQTDKYIF